MNKKQAGELGSAVGTILALGIVIILLPIVQIWAWNVLFGSFITIELNFVNWLAVSVIGSIFKSHNKTK